MTRNEILTIAAANADAMTCGRLRLVLNQFKTVTDFLNASTGDLMGAYNKARPDGKRGLGQRFFKALESIKEEIARQRFLAHEHDEEDAKQHVEEPLPPATAMFTATELTALSEFMATLGLEQIDVITARKFLDGCVKSEKEEGVAPCNQ